MTAQHRNILDQSIDCSSEFKSEFEVSFKLCISFNLSQKLEKRNLHNDNIPVSNNRGCHGN